MLSVGDPTTSTLADAPVTTALVPHDLGRTAMGFDDNFGSNDAFGSSNAFASSTSSHTTTAAASPSAFNTGAFDNSGFGSSDAFASGDASALQADVRRETEANTAVEKEVLSLQTETQTGTKHAHQRNA